MVNIYEYRIFHSEIVEKHIFIDRYYLSVLLTELSTFDF